MVSSMPDEPAKVKIANTTSLVPLSICFMNSTSGV
jgi:hypothetical protein